MTTKMEEEELATIKISNSNGVMAAISNKVKRRQWGSGFEDIVCVRYKD